MQMNDTYEIGNQMTSAEFMSTILEMNQQGKGENTMEMYENQKEEFYSKAAEITGMSENLVRYLDTPHGMDAVKGVGVTGGAQEFQIGCTNCYVEYCRPTDTAGGSFDNPHSIDFDYQAMLDGFGFGFGFGLGMGFGLMIGQLDSLSDEYRQAEEAIIREFGESISAPPNSGELIDEHINETCEHADISTRTLEVLEATLTLDVVSNWDFMTLDQKAQVLDTIARNIGDSTGINIHGVYIVDLNGALGVNDGSGWQGLDVNHVMNDCIGEVMDTLLHEIRHEYQREVIANPQNYDYPPELVNAWADNMVNYIHFNDDPMGYRYQPLEVDANDWADAMIDAHINNLRGMMKGE
jgi:hypothetical protein